MSNARSRMTMRATVKRQSGATRNPDRQVVANLVDQPNAIPCWLFSRSETKVIGETQVNVEQLHMLVPIAADVTDDDQISAVKDRRGTVIDSHLMRISADRRVGGSHRELALEVIS